MGRQLIKLYYRGKVEGNLIFVVDRETDKILKGADSQSSAVSLENLPWRCQLLGEYAESLFLVTRINKIWCAYITVIFSEWPHRRVLNASVPGTMH